MEKFGMIANLKGGLQDDRLPAILKPFANQALLRMDSSY